MKEFNYTNDLGYHKKLVVSSISDDGVCSFTLWSNDTGEFCGSGQITIRDLDNFLTHYGVDSQMTGRW